MYQYLKAREKKTLFCGANGSGKLCLLTHLRRCWGLQKDQFESLILFLCPYLSFASVSYFLCVSLIFSSCSPFSRSRTSSSNSDFSVISCALLCCSAATFSYTFYSGSSATLSVILTGVRFASPDWFSITAPPKLWSGCRLTKNETVRRVVSMPYHDPAYHNSALYGPSCNCWFCYCLFDA